MTKTSIVILDFDGVILESVNAKTQAFSRLFQNEDPVDVEFILAHHAENNGISRFEKFQHIYRNILRKNLDNSGIEKLAERFETLTVDSVLGSPYVEGAKEFIEQYHSSHHLYIASGTPEVEMKMIVDRLGIAPYFKGVFGSPDKKDVIAKRILSTHGALPQQAIFVGDSLSDMEAATKTGIPFVGRKTAENANLFMDASFPLIDDLSSLGALLARE